MIKNYLDLGRHWLFFHQFFFLDTEDYLADQLFIRHKVRAWFRGEYARPDHPYRFICCFVRRKDKQRFLDALSELPDKMAILGHTDYDAFCEKWDGIFRSVKEKGAESLSADYKEPDRVFV